MKQLTTEQAAQLVIDPQHLRNLTTFWAENTLIHQMATLLLAYREAESKPVAYLTWLQGMRAIDDCVEYMVVAEKSDKSDGGSPAFPVYTSPVLGLEAAQRRVAVRADHAAWADETFGNIGPVGPLKHLSKEALEAAEAPGDVLEWADMQFLLWDAQRRAGISDDDITRAMVKKLEINKARDWPEPKDGEPRFHVKETANQVKRKGIRISQIELIAAILKEIARQLPGAAVEHARVNSIIQAADTLCAELAEPI